MGAALVAVATMKWPHVSDDAFRVLVRMALVARDRESATAPERRYFGGHDGLMDVLGRAGQSRKTKLRRVSEAIAELVQVGAVVCEQRGNNGSNAVYELTLDAVPMPAKPKRVRSKTFADQDAHGSRAKDAHSAPIQDAHSAPIQDAHSAPIQDAHSAPPPYKEEELLEETQEESLEEHGGSPPSLRVVTGRSAGVTSPPAQRGLWPAVVPTPGELARADVRRLLEDRKRGRKTA